MELFNHQGTATLKTTLISLFLLSLSLNSYAFPIRCFSVEEAGGEPLFQFKLSTGNQLKKASRRSSEFVIGLTDNEGKKKIIHFDSKVSANEIRANFVDKGWLNGYLLVERDLETDTFTGIFKHSEISNKDYLIECFESL